jgi:hypothetical protein
MIKNFLMLLVLCCFSVFGVKYHQDSRGAEIHTPFRWVVADSTAKAALSLAAADTQKFCFQLSDTSIWCLIDNSPLRWAFISGKKADSLLIRTFQAVTAGITRMNIDTAKVRAEAIDTLTAGIIKGAKTFRDTSNFTGGAYFAGIARFAGTLYAPKVDIDSMVGDVKIGGNLSISVPANNCYYSANSQCGTIYFGSSKTGGGYFHAGVENAMKILGVGGYPLVISHSSNQPIIFGTNDIERARIHGNGNVKFAGACTTSTLNTGNGDNELYPMNQDVRTTASPTFAGVTTNVTGNCSGSSGSCTGNAATATTATNVTGGTVDATTGTFSGAVQGKTFNSGLGATEIPLYTSGSFTMTLHENSTDHASGTAYWQRIGSVVTLLIPQLLGTLSGSDVTLTGLPTEILPYKNQNFTKSLYSNDAIISGTMSLFFNSNYIDVNKIDGSDLSAGSSGIPGGTSITYFAN